MASRLTPLLGTAATAVLSITLAGVMPAVAQNTSSGIEEVVVTAQKINQNINDIGMSIQAASGDQLKNLGVTDTAQLQKIVPGFTYTPAAYGTPVYSIRGIGFQDTSLADSPTVSVYQDQVPLPYSIMTLGTTLDLERVEVLKGPQGTLFGENATGGAINYIANKPTDNFEAGADASFGRFNTADLTGFVSGPVTDTLDVRFAARVTQSDGWQKSYTRPHDDPLGAKAFYNGRLSVLWHPTERFRALFTVNAYKDQSESQAPQLFRIGILNTNTPIPAGLAHYPLAPRNDRAADWGPCVNTSAFIDRCTGYKKDNSLLMFSLRMDYDLGNDMTLTSLTAHEHFDRYEPIEGDGTTYRDYESVQSGFIDTTYQELRLAGTFAGKGDWIAGGNYEYDTTWDTFLQTYPDSSSSTVFGVPLGPTRPVDHQITSTYAFFGNVDYPVTDTLMLQGGIRYTNERKSFTGCEESTDNGIISQLLQNFLKTGNPFVGDGIIPPPGACASLGPAPDFLPEPTNAKLDEDNVSWRVGVNWKVVPGTLLYANVSQGYKGGGFPTLSAARQTQFEPVVQESLLAYEAGVKSTLFENTLQLNGAVFYYKYKNKQILGDILDPIFGALPALVNVPKSHVLGFEVSADWLPIAGLSIKPAVSYAASRIDGNFSNFNYLAQIQNFTGERFPFAPEWQGDVDVQYEWPLRGSLAAFVGANVNLQGSTNSGFGDFPELAVPFYTLVDLRAGVENDTWRFQVWGHNVFDKYYWTAAYHVNDVFVRYTGMPATYGFTLSYRFH